VRTANFYSNTQLRLFQYRIRKKTPPLLNLLNGLFAKKLSPTFGSANWISGSGVAKRAGVSRSDDAPE
jgi:hypothetical protein